MTIISCRNK